MIELLNMNVHTIIIDDLDLQNKLPIGMHAHNIEPWIKQVIVYEWYRESVLGQHLVSLSDPDRNDIDIVKHFCREAYNIEHHIHISAWLSQEQIDRIELAFFVTLRRKSHRSKYSFESL